jgi:hypothetical protein
VAERVGHVAAGEHGHGVEGHGDGGHGELATIDPADLPTGSVVTESGRVSAAEIYRDPSPTDHPFSPSQLTRLDEALTMASRESALASGWSKCSPGPRRGCGCPTAARSSP